MEITWDHAKQVQVGTGLVNVPAGAPFEMPDEEALNRLAHGEIGLNADPAEVLAAEARVKPAAQEPQDGAETPETSGASPEAVAGVSVVPGEPEIASDRIEKPKGKSK